MPHLVEGTREARGADESAARLHATYGRATILGADLGMSDRFAGDARFLLTETQYRGRFDVLLELDHVVVNTADAGASWRMGRDEGRLEDGPTLFQPDVPITARLDGLRTRALVLDRDALTETARAIYADDALRLRFDDHRPTGPVAAAQWASVFAVAASLTAQLSSDLVRASTYRLLAVATLESFRLSGDHARRYETAVGLLSAYRRAVVFIDEHASLPISVADIARAAGVSLADLRRAFRARSIESPSPEAHLRRARLSLARTDLLRGDPRGGDTVRDVATRWGFAHAGRFARWYAQAYGETPGRTLRR